MSPHKCVLPHEPPHSPTHVPARRYIPLTREPPRSPPHAPAMPHAGPSCSSPSSALRRSASSPWPPHPTASSCSGRPSWTAASGEGWGECGNGGVGGWILVHDGRTSATRKERPRTRAQRQGKPGVMPPCILHRAPGKAHKGWILPLAMPPITHWPTHRRTASAGSSPVACPHSHLSPLCLSLLSSSLIGRRKSWIIPCGPQLLTPLPSPCSPAPASAGVRAGSSPCSSSPRPCSSYAPATSRSCTKPPTCPHSPHCSPSSSSWRPHRCGGVGYLNAALSIQARGHAGGGTGVQGLVWKLPGGAGAGRHAPNLPPCTASHASFAGHCRGWVGTDAAIPGQRGLRVHMPDHVRGAG